MMSDMPETSVVDGQSMTRPGWARDLKYRFQYLVLRSVMEAAGLLPRRLAHAAGLVLGEFVYRVLRVRRRVVEENLELTIGRTFSRARINAIARGVYHHLGRTLLEYGRFRRLTRARLDEWVEVHGFERVEQAHALGRGVILVTGHFGNWELMGAAVSMRGYPVHFLAKEQRNPYVDRYMNMSRGHLGVGLVHPGPELRRVYRRLREGEIVGMLFDQDAGLAGVFIDVLGRVASVQPGAAIFAQRTGAPIIPGCIVRLPDGRHRVDFEEPIHPDPGAPQEAEILRLVRLSSLSLERVILRHPEQYYWVHRRWKTRPPAEDPSEGRAAGDDGRQAGDDRGQAGDDGRQAGDDGRQAGDDGRQAGDDRRQAGDDRGQDEDVKRSGTSPTR